MYSNTTDGSTDNEAVKIANAFKPFWKKWMKEWGRNCVRSKKMTVTTAPSMSTGLIGVTDAFSDTECMIPFQNNVANANVGDTVWVKWMYDNQQTMYAENMGDIRSEKVILSGVKNAEPVPSGGSVSHSISFEKPFKETPVVVASMISPHSVETGLCSVRIWDISPFAFTVGYQNGSQYSRNIGASWIATGELLNNPIQYITDTTPYLNRAIPYSSNYLNLNKVVGGTVSWNQYALYDESTPSNGWTSLRVSLSISGQTMTITSTVDATSTKACTMRNFATVSGHKYYLSGYVTPSTSYNAVVGFYTSGGSAMDRVSLSANSGLCDVSRILSANANGGTFRIGPATAAPIGTVTTAKDIMLIDLTQMFGSTIADYVYTIEQANAGAGVAWVRKLFPSMFYDRNAGELLSVKTSAHKMVGFNQWDEEWELGTLNWSTGANASSTTRIRSKNYIPCIGDTVYYVRIPTSAVYLFYYDADKNFISYLSSSKANATFTTPSNARYIRFFTANNNYGTTYNDDICINIHDGDRDGEYEAYQEWNYPLDSDLELRGIPKLDANSKLYYDGDTYESDGTVTRKYGVVDLGTLDWRKSSSVGSHVYATIAIRPYKASIDALMVCSKYVHDGGASGSPYYGENGTFRHFYRSDSNTGEFYISDSSFTDLTVAQVKSALSGEYIVYELATPTTETADEYARLQKCDPNGTEQFIDERTVQIPVGHETEYIIL